MFKKYILRTNVVPATKDRAALILTEDIKTTGFGKRPRKNILIPRKLPKRIQQRIAVDEQTNQ
jgi:hypothetical protein